MSTRDRVWVILGTILFFLAGFGGGTAQEETELELFLLSDATVNAETSSVSVDFVLLENKLPVVDLTPSTIQLSDEVAGTPTLTLDVQRTLHLAMVVELSLGSDADLVRNTLRAYFDTYYRPEDDHITLYILDAAVPNSQQPRIVSIESLEQAREVIEGLRSADRFYSVNPTLRQVQSDLQQIEAVPRVTRQVLFVGSFINRPAEATDVSSFAEDDILVHGIQAHRNRENFTTVFRSIANTGGGLFANNYNGDFVLRGENYEPVNNLKILYDTISNSRLGYTLSYISNSQTLQNPRTVTMTVTLPLGLSAEQSFSYDFPFRPPEVAFLTAPERGFDVTRRPYREEDLSLAFDLPQRLVPVQVSFPDGVTRSLTSLQFEVLHAETGEILQSELVTDPVLEEGGRYTFTWLLDSYSSPDSFTQVRLRVSAVDERGLQNDVVADGSVRVASAPPLPTETPTNTPVPTATNTPTPQPTVTLIPPAPPASGGSDAAAINDILTNPPGSLLLLANLVLILLVLILLVRVVSLRRTAARAAAVISGANDSADEAMLDTHPPQGAEVVQEIVVDNREERNYAQLVPSNGAGTILEDIKQIWIDAPEFVIGRAQDCNYVLDSPTLSPKHCQLRVDEQDQIYVRDLGSVNGTYINGERISANEDVYVPLGSEIGVTKDLVFELHDPTTTPQTRAPSTVSRASSVYTSADGGIPFKPLPGVRYAPDNGPPVTDEYTPI